MSASAGCQLLLAAVQTCLVIGDPLQSFNSSCLCDSKDIACLQQSSRHNSSTHSAVVQLAAHQHHRFAQQAPDAELMMVNTTQSLLARAAASQIVQRSAPGLSCLHCMHRCLS